LRVLRTAIIPALATYAWKSLWAELRHNESVVRAFENRAPIVVH
jgi:hypothetical protein